MAENEGPTFRRSSRCGESGCVEVAATPDGFLIRDSTGDGTTLEFDAEAWSAFVAAVREGRFG